MRKYLITTFLFGFGYLGLSTFIMLSGWHTNILPNKGIYEAIRRSKSEQKSTRLLIIGDSVAKQIFEQSNDVDTITSLACNQSIDIVGHYLLLKDFLQRNPSVERIAFIYNPFSFENDLDHKYTYNYFLKPFYNNYYRPEFTEHVKAQIEKIPYVDWVNFPPIATTFWTPDYHTSSDKELFLSTTSWEYMKKIVELTARKGVALTLLAAPVKISRKGEVQQLKSDYESSGRQLEVFEEYFQNINYLPDTLFLDEIHFEHPEALVPIVEAQF